MLMIMILTVMMMMMNDASVDDQLTCRRVTTVPHAMSS
jgi:hypothetical protein